MGRKKAPSEAVLTDSTNSAASAQTHAGEHSSQGTHAGKFVPGTFSRKAKVRLPHARVMLSLLQQLLILQQLSAVRSNEHHNGLCRLL